MVLVLRDFSKANRLGPAIGPRQSLFCEELWHQRPHRLFLRLRRTARRLALTTHSVVPFIYPLTLTLIVNIARKIIDVDRLLIPWRLMAQPCPQTGPVSPGRGWRRVQGWARGAPARGLRRRSRAGDPGESQNRSHHRDPGPWAAATGETRSVAPDPDRRLVIIDFTLESCRK